MSKCISRHGEFGEHELDADYVCGFCSVLDEDALIEELRRVRAQVASLADRLLPPVVQTREEWGSINLRSGGAVICGTREGAERFMELAKPRTPFEPADPHALAVRTVTTLADDGSPYGGTTLTGRWREVSES